MKGSPQKYLSFSYPFEIFHQKKISDSHATIQSSWSNGGMWSVAVSPFPHSFSDGGNCVRKQRPISWRVAIHTSSPSPLKNLRIPRTPANLDGRPEILRCRPMFSILGHPYSPSARRTPTPSRTYRINSSAVTKPLG